MNDIAMHFVWIINSDGQLLEVHGYSDPHMADQEFTGTCQAYGFEPSAEHFARGWARTPDDSFVCFRHADAPTHGTRGSFDAPAFNVTDGNTDNPRTEPADGAGL